MNEIEAVQILKDHIVDWKANKEYAFKFYRAVGVAITALREQQSREEGCDYCGLIYKLDGASYGADSVIIKNRFCPMCGKRLEVEP